MSASTTMTPVSVDGLNRLVRRVDEVSSLPDTALRVMEVVNDPTTSAADLQAVVECDAAIVARMLRTINSSAYALRTRVDSIHRAVSLLGFNTVKNLALTACVAQIFKGGSAIGTYSRPALWQHLVFVAVASRMIAARCGVSQFDEAYMCGLLHDLGIILIDQHQHEDFVQVISELTPDVPTDEIERMRLGFDHAQLGARIAEKWGLPDCVVESIRHHHDATRAGETHRQIVRVVEVANFLCAAKGFSSVGVPNVRTPARETFAALSIGKSGLKSLFEDLDREFDRARESMEL